MWTKVYSRYHIRQKMLTLAPLPKDFEGLKFFIIFFTFGFTKFKQVLLKTETFLTSQNLTKYRALSEARFALFISLRFSEK